MFDVDALLEAILPARCALCAGPGIGERICPGCRADLPWLMGHCPGCGIALTPGQASCGRCASPRRAAARVFAPLAYAYPVDRLVTGAKFHRRLQDARLLGLLLADALAGAMASGRLEPVDLILPVPLHRRRLGARGYNQALEIARPLAARLALPLDPDACARVRPTREQAGLPAAERRRNLRAAFIARTPVRGLRVAIVDDVITTGSTVAALAQALRRAGAAQVQAWVAARTL